MILHDRYEFDEFNKIGEGGSSCIYKGFDLVDKKYVAVKHMYSWSKPLNTHQNEYTVLSAVRHSLLPLVYDFVYHNDSTSYTILEYIDGSCLSDFLYNYPANMDYSLLIKYAIDITVATRALHDLDITHCDIKPDNIMIRKNGDLCLIDFNTARIHGISAGYINRSVGYSAPEHLDYFLYANKYRSFRNEEFKVLFNNVKDKIDWKLCDIYSIGATIKTIYDSKSFNQEKDVNHTLSSLPDIFNKAMSFNPAHRHQSTDELLVDLRNLYRSYSPLSSAA